MLDVRLILTVPSTKSASLANVLTSVTKILAMVAVIAMILACVLQGAALDTMIVPPPIIVIHAPISARKSAVFTTVVLLDMASIAKTTFVPLDAKTTAIAPPTIIAIPPVVSARQSVPMPFVMVTSTARTITPVSLRLVALRSLLDPSLHLVKPDVLQIEIVFQVRSTVISPTLSA